MTGYAVETAELAAGSLSLEIRAVNARYLDLGFRLNEDFRTLEPLLRERIARRVKRGKLECRIGFQPRESASLPDAPNAALLDQLVALAAAVRTRAPDAAPLSVAEILRWPGMLGETRLDLEALHAVALDLLDRALDELDASRAREGEKLKAILLERIAAIRGHVTALAPRLPEIVNAYRDKLTRRMEEVLATPDRDRILQEVALYAQKIDVDEELGRLESHLTEVERVLQAGGAAGKRLDFLMQELNREANTLGSKSVTVELAQVAVELKVLIEQMREQVQNIE
jgi:uncharacterized protein (TIGR00255 family)